MALILDAVKARIERYRKRTAISDLSIVNTCFERGIPYPEVEDSNNHIGALINALEIRKTTSGVGNGQTTNKVDSCPTSSSSKSSSQEGGGNTERPKDVPAKDKADPDNSPGTTGKSTGQSSEATTVPIKQQGSGGKDTQGGSGASVGISDKFRRWWPYILSAVLGGGTAVPGWAIVEHFLSDNVVVEQPLEGESSLNQWITDRNLHIPPEQRPTEED